MIGALLVVLAGHVCGETLPMPHLQIKPGLCVLAEDEELCTTTVTVLWRSQQPKNACLTQDNKTIQCWTDKQAGTHSVTLETRRSVQFTLTDQDTGAKLTSKTFNVTQDKPHARQARRNAWSFF